MKKVLLTEKNKGEKITLSNYTHIRAYHACRIEDIEAYKKNGIVPFTEQSAIEDAVKKLSDERLTEDDVRAQAEKIWEEYGIYIHKVWLSLEQSELLGDACHYLIYGSEFLNAVAAHLWCRDKLKTIGKGSNSCDRRNCHKQAWRGKLCDKLYFSWIISRNKACRQSYSDNDY